MVIDIFPLIDRVNFELSNYCNYAKLHPMCPASLVNDPKTLSSTIVKNVIESLGRRDFEGIISFHQYTEPMVEPRLFSFIAFTKKACPKGKIFIWTNGSNLSQGMMNELVDAGISALHITAYSEKERERLEKINIKIPHYFSPINWVNVINTYDFPINVEWLHRPCYAPLTDLIIGIGGHISLCCRDWKREYKLFDLNKRSFEEIFTSKELLSIYENLSKGKREFALCQRCGTCRDCKVLKRSLMG